MPHFMWFDIFASSLIAYMFFTITEIFQPGFISYYFNTSIFLVVALVSGIIWVISKNK